MEIEQKERERIEADIDAYIKDLWHDVHSPNNNSPKIVEAITHFRAGKQSEHLHFQKEVIQPKDKRISELEAEIKALREAAQNLVTAIEQRSFFQEGYRNGSASISEVMAAGDVEVKAYEAMGKLLTKNEG